jgi:hypothetical protein
MCVCPPCADNRDHIEQAGLVMGNVLIGVFAVTLCLINAVVWTLVSEMPFMGACWLLAAGLCVYLQKWSRLW